MTEIKYITQNGQTLNFKDATGREMLVDKQAKLKAGKGINIANDGTISVKDALGSDFKDFTIENFNIDMSDYECDPVSVGSMQIKYKGNLSLLKDVVDGSESSGAYSRLVDLFDSYERPLDEGDFDDNVYRVYNTLRVGKVIATAIEKAISDGSLEDTGEDYLYFIPKTINNLNCEGGTIGDNHIDRVSCNMIISLKIANDNFTLDNGSGSIEYLPEGYYTNRLLGAYIVGSDNYYNTNWYKSWSCGTEAMVGIYSELIALI